MPQRPIDLSKMTLPEIFSHISELKATERKTAIVTIARLVPQVKELLRLNFNKSIVFDLPKGNPPYTPLNIPDNFGYNRLRSEMRKFKYFFVSSSPNLKQIKRESIFIELLESVSQEEAELVIAIKDKKLKYKGITRKLIEDTMPEIFEGEDLGK